MDVKNIEFSPGYITVTFADGPKVQYPIANILRAADIPSLAASAITSGDFASAQIGDGAVIAAKLGTDAVETIKINDAAVTVAKLSSALLGYLLSHARVDFSNVDYCKVA